MLLVERDDSFGFHMEMDSICFGVLCYNKSFMEDQCSKRSQSVQSYMLFKCVVVAIGTEHEFLSMKIL